jgi:hypothetical protein
MSPDENRALLNSPDYADKKQKMENDLTENLDSRKKELQGFQARAEQSEERCKQYEADYGKLSKKKQGHASIPLEFWKERIGQIKDLCKQVNDEIQRVEKEKAQPLKEQPLDQEIKEQPLDQETPESESYNRQTM